MEVSEARRLKSLEDENRRLKQLLAESMLDNAVVFKRFPGLETKTCPFKNLPEARRGQWGEGLIAAEMEKCCWLKPRLIVTIDYLERTATNHLRHPMFSGLVERATSK